MTAWSPTAVCARVLVSKRAHTCVVRAAAAATAVMQDRHACLHMHACTRGCRLHEQPCCYTGGGCWCQLPSTRAIPQQRIRMDRDACRQRCQAQCAPFRREHAAAASASAHQCAATELHATCYMVPCCLPPALRFAQRKGRQLQRRWRRPDPAASPTHACIPPAQCISAVPAQPPPPSPRQAVGSSTSHVAVAGSSSRAARRGVNSAQSTFLFVSRLSGCSGPGRLAALRLGVDDVHWVI